MRGGVDPIPYCQDRNEVCPDDERYVDIAGA